MPLFLLLHEPTNSLAFLYHHLSFVKLFSELSYLFFIFCISQFLPHAICPGIFFLFSVVAYLWPFLSSIWLLEVIFFSMSSSLMSCTKPLQQPALLLPLTSPILSSGSGLLESTGSPSAGTFWALSFAPSIHSATFQEHICSFFIQPLLEFLKVLPHSLFTLETFTGFLHL